MIRDFSMRSKSQSVIPEFAALVKGAGPVDTMADAMARVIPTLPDFSLSRARYSTNRGGFDYKDIKDDGPSEMAKLRQELANAKREIAMLKSKKLAEAEDKKIKDLMETHGAGTMSN